MTSPYTSQKFWTLRIDKFNRMPEYPISPGHFSGLFSVPSIFDFSRAYDERHAGILVCHRVLLYYYYCRRSMLTEHLVGFCPSPSSSYSSWVGSFRMIRLCNWVRKQHMDACLLTVSQNWRKNVLFQSSVSCSGSRCKINVYKGVSLRVIR